MKIKNDFITNSSSTSYIISCSEKIELGKNNIVEDLLKSVTKHCDFITTIEKLDWYFDKEYGEDWKKIEEYTDVMNIYNECLSEIEAGFTIIGLYLSYSEETYNFPDRFIKKHGGKVIQIRN